MSERLPQLQKLYEVDPNDPFLTYGIALEHAKAGDADEALSWLDRTIAIEPRYAYAYFQKGKLLADMDRTAEARTVLQDGIAQAREAGEAHAVEELTGLLESL